MFYATKLREAPFPKGTHQKREEPWGDAQLVCMGLIPLNPLGLLLAGSRKQTRAITLYTEHYYHHFRPGPWILNSPDTSTASSRSSGSTPRTRQIPKVNVELRSYVICCFSETVIIILKIFLQDLKWNLSSLKAHNMNILLNLRSTKGFQDAVRKKQEMNISSPGKLQQLLIYSE